MDFHQNIVFSKERIILIWSFSYYYLLLNCIPALIYSKVHLCIIPYLVNIFCINKLDKITKFFMVTTFLLKKVNHILAACHLLFHCKLLFLWPPSQPLYGPIFTWNALLMEILLVPFCQRNLLLTVLMQNVWQTCIDLVCTYLITKLTTHFINNHRKKAS